MLTPFQAPGQLFQPPPLHTDSTTIDSNSNNNETITNEKLPIRCCAPAHTTIEANTLFTAAKTQLIDAGITYPVLAKSLFADGSGSSHSLAVIRSDAGLLKITQGELKSEGIELPLLFEQYIDHGKCLFKVYVLGNHEVMVTRPSLHLDDQVDDKEIAGEIEEEKTINAHMEESRREPIEEAGTSPPVLQLEERRNKFEIAPPDVEVVSRVSAYPRCRSWGKDDLAPRGHGVPSPPELLWRGIAAKLRSELGLTLFNFDIIVPLTQPVDSTFEKLVHVIDINYFPGIEKLPNYEALLVQFFLDLKNESKSWKGC
jgi:inositol-1,3,4-trisphosphate 5/6-kinase/inositol-tetrakisphosphate 1-kinase